MSKMDWDELPPVRERTFQYFGRGMRTLWKLLGDERRPMLLAVALLVVTQLLDLAFPVLFKRVIDEMPDVVSGGGIRTISVLLLLILATRLAAISLNHFVKEPIFLKSVIRLENEWPVLAQDKLLALQLSYHERENTGRKIAKVSKGVEKLVGILVDLYWAFLPSANYLVLNLIILAVMDWRLALVMILPLGPAIAFYLKGYERCMPIWEAWEVRKEESNGYFCQSLINVRTVQAFVQEERERERVKAVRRDMTDMDTFACLSVQRYGFAQNVALFVSLLATIVLGLYFVFRGWSTIGTVTYVCITGNVAMRGVWDVLQAYTRILKNLVAAERMHALLMEPEEVVNAEGAVLPQSCASAFRFDRVTFRYSERNERVLDDVSLSIQQGEMLALIGRSGAGKTTLVNLLMRAYDVTEGAITLDGSDIRGIDRDWYRGRFAVVHEDVEIFDGTIRQNVAYAHPNATEEEVAEAVQAAYLTETLADDDTFPDGLETMVGERGVRLSGGQRQRVGIARAYLAILRGARVLILDEATSRLDSESERAVQHFLAMLRFGKQITIIAIAHRLATIRSADRILVIDDGGIVEEGDHEALLRQNGLYSRLVAMQRLGAVRD